MHPGNTTFSTGPLHLIENGLGLPRIVVQQGDRYLTIMAFEERSMAGNDGHAESWANARHVFGLLTAPAPVENPEHVNAFADFGHLIDLAIAEYEAGRSATSGDRA